MHVPLYTKQHKLVPASAGTYCTTGAVLAGWQPIGQTLQLVANWRHSSIANTCGCPCIHLRFVGCLNKRTFIYLFYLFPDIADHLIKSRCHLPSSMEKSNISNELYLLQLEELGTDSLLGTAHQLPKSSHPAVNANAVADHLIQVAQSPHDKKFER